MSKTQLVIETRGGVIQEIYAPNPWEFDIKVIDWDTPDVWVHHPMSDVHMPTETRDLAASENQRGF